MQLELQSVHILFTPTLSSSLQYTEDDSMMQKVSGMRFTPSMCAPEFYFCLPAPQTEQGTWTYFAWPQPACPVFVAFCLTIHILVHLSKHTMFLHYYFSLYKITYRGCQSRWRHRQTWLASLHNHIKITAKIQHNHHAGMSEMELNGSLTTTELKKPHPSRLVGGTQNGLAPRPHG